MFTRYLHIEWATNPMNNEIISATLKVFLDFHPIKTLTIGMVQIESGLLLNRFIKTETLIFSWSLVTMSGFSQSKDSSQSKSNEMSGEKRPTNEQSEFPESKRSRNVTEAVKNVKSGKAVKGLPTRAYLDSTVVPILLEGLAALSRERPEDPIDYLIGFLQKHKKEHSNKELGLKN